MRVQVEGMERTGVLRWYTLPFWKAIKTAIKYGCRIRVVWRNNGP